jgi:hypothetical protein
MQNVVGIKRRAHFLGQSDFLCTVGYMALQELPTLVKIDAAPSGIENLADIPTFFDASHNNNSPCCRQGR